MNNHRAGTPSIDNGDFANLPEYTPESFGNEPDTTAIASESTEQLLPAAETPNTYTPLAHRTDSPSDYSDTCIPVELECTICSRREIRVRFAECTHAACNSCVKRLWRSAKGHVDHFPMSFVCPWCRVKVRKVGELSEKRKPLKRFFRLGDEVWYGDFMFMVWQWESIKAWIARSSRTDGIAMLRYGVRNIRNTMTLNPFQARMAGSTWG